MAQPDDVGRVLLIEGSPAEARRLQGLLFEAASRLPNLCSHVETLAQALDRLEADHFDVMLLDLTLPDSHGLDTFARLHTRARGLPIIVLAAAAEEAQAMEAVELGAHDYLVKGRSDSGLLARALRHAIQRYRSELALREMQARLAGIIESAMDAVITTDSRHNIVLFNRAAEQIFGYPAAEVLGQPLGRLVPQRFRPAHQGHVERFGQTGETIRNMHLLGEVYGLRASGEEFPAEAAISKLETASDTYFTVILRDITRRKQHERELAAIASLSAALRTAATRQEMLPVILDEARSLLEASVASFFRQDDGSGGMVIELSRGAGTNRAGNALRLGEDMAAHILATGQPYLSNELSQEPRRGRPDALPDFASAVAVPLQNQGLAIGVLWLARDRPFAEADAALLTSLGDIAASALRRAGLYEQTEQRLRRLSALRAIDLAISASLDKRLTLSVVLDQAVRELSVDAAAVLLMNPVSRTLDYAAGRGFRGLGIEAARVALGEGYAGRAAREQRTIAIPDLSQAAPLARLASLAVEGFAAYYATPLVSKGHVTGILEVFHRAPLRVGPEWLQFFEAVAGQTAIAIDNARLFESLQKSNANMALAYDHTLEGWSRALDLRDKETEGHSQRVTELAVRLARAMGVGEAALAHLRRGALLHDIGKMGIPDSILAKPGPLDEGEWVVMKRHPDYAFEILSPIDYLRPALDIPYCHHEKWDGAGYPRGLAGEAIPLAARIFAVVDVWDALRSERPYRPGWPAERAREYIEQGAGAHFDPQVVDAFLRLLDLGESAEA
jgi:PAS domain S-box-containing protein/putative nucleotidyltransferase with HDIG domain